MRAMIRLKLLVGLGGRPVTAYHFAVLFIRKAIGELLARRVTIDILGRQIDEVLFCRSGPLTSRSRSICAKRRSIFARVKFLSRLLTALNLLSSIATLAVANRPIARQCAPSGPLPR
jgi:hypothetical protein